MRRRHTWSGLKSAEKLRRPILNIEQNGATWDRHRHEEMSWWCAGNWRYRPLLIQISHTRTFACCAWLKRADRAHRHPIYWCCVEGIDGEYGALLCGLAKRLWIIKISCCTESVSLCSFRLEAARKKNAEEVNGSHTCTHRVPNCSSSLRLFECIEFVWFAYLNGDMF